MAFKLFSGISLALHLLFLFLLYLNEKDKDASLTILKFWFGKQRSHTGLRFLMLLVSMGTAAVLTAIIVAVFFS